MDNMVEITTDDLWRMAGIPPLTEAAIRQLAEIAAIPSKDLEMYGRALGSCFGPACEVHRARVHYCATSKKKEKLFEKFNEIVRAAAALGAALDALGDDIAAQEKLGIFLRRQEEFGDTQGDSARRLQINDLEMFCSEESLLSKVETYRKTISNLQAAASTREWPRGQTGGASSKSIFLPGNPNVTACDFFVFSVVRETRRHGGELSLDKNQLSGTLIDFLNYARPLLLRGMIPEAFSGSRLQYLRDAATGKLTPSDIRALEKECHFQHWTDT